MESDFYRQPILNSPYEYPDKHWALDEHGQPTNVKEEKRRVADFVTPIPQSKRGKKAKQQEMTYGEAEGISAGDQRYEKTAALVNAIRAHVDAWRKLPDERDWGVSPVTQQLLRHWRTHTFTRRRPFFCQIEAVEVAIWLAEVAPGKKQYAALLEQIEAANSDANPGLNRIALKLATGAGKTTVMAMLIAWQTLNAVRSPNSSKFTRGFLIITPGITVKDRLRVLQPNDVNNYYRDFELVPDGQMLDQMKSAQVVITNFHAFKHRETLELSKGNRELLEGRTDQIETLETDGEMLKRAIGPLASMKHILVLNDEAHHCYRQKPGESEESKPKGDELTEAKANDEEARIWISGIEALGDRAMRVYDLSATPFFLRGSGYAEGTLFGWTVSDFSLMDAIECGIVKLPRIPVDDNDIVNTTTMPTFRDLWEHIRDDMPKGKSTSMTVDDLPSTLTTAIEALYGHYEKTSKIWDDKKGIDVPPCFIVVCNNISTARLIYDYVSGFEVPREDGTSDVVQGRCKLFSNFDEHRQRFDKPNTILVDSEQLESGDNDQLSAEFRKLMAPEIEKFRKERQIREGSGDDSKYTDGELLREVMNTVGKKGTLGEQIRCVVSVSMLTEGWDANNVTHILGIRAFGTQLLCEQVIGRALRRTFYPKPDEIDLLKVEYADILGIPFNFAAEPVKSEPTPPKPMVEVMALQDRAHLTINFPRIRGYRVELPADKLEATFNDDSHLRLDPALLEAATRTKVEGIVGEGDEMNLDHTLQTRPHAITRQLTGAIVRKKFSFHDYQNLRPIVRHWMDNYVTCVGGTYKAQLLFPAIADMAADKIHQAVTRRFIDERPVVAIPDPNAPIGTTRGLYFRTGKTGDDELYQTGENPARCHLNYCVLDSAWEREFCRVAEGNDRVMAYVKNHNLGFEVPYTMAGKPRIYRPDYIVYVDDGHGPDDPLKLVVEVKGYRGEDAKQKAETMKVYWVPGVNRLGKHGRWAFVEFTDGYEMQSNFEQIVEEKFNEMVDSVAAEAEVAQ